MLGFNALGGIRLKPLLIYHSQTLRAEYSEQHLQIIWMLTQRAWMKRDIFQEWFFREFDSEVMRYYELPNSFYCLILLIEDLPKIKICL